MMSSMRKLSKYTLTVFVTIALFGFANSAFAAWPATETFDSYSAGDALDAKSGGSGWNTNWASNVQGTIQTAPTGMSSLAARFQSATDGVEAGRQFTASGLTEVTFQVNSAQTNAAFAIRIQEAAVAERIQVVFNASGNIVANATNIQAYSANTTYTIKLKWGHSGTNFAISIDGGAYSADIGIYGASTTMNNFVFGPQTTTSTTFYVDTIGPVVVASAQTPINSLVKSQWIF